MAQIVTLRDKNGTVTGYRFRTCLGRDEHNKKIIVNKKIERPEGLTPAKEGKEVARQADAWEIEQKNIYQQTIEKQTKEFRDDRQKITIPEFVRKYWFPRHVENGTHTPETIAYYSFCVDNIKLYFNTEKPKLKMIDVKKTDIIDCLEYFRKTAKKRNGEPLSKTTVQHYYRTIKNILNYAVYLEFIPVNPCDKLRQQDIPKKDTKEIDFLEKEEAIRFLSCLDSEKEVAFWKRYHRRSNLMWKCIVNMLILTGLRRGELVGLRWEDLQEDRTLYVRRNVTIDTTHKGSSDRTEKYHIGELKTKESRKVYVSQFLYDLLAEYRQEQENIYGAKFLSSAYIFCRSDNLYEPMYPTEPTRQMSKYIKRHNLPDISPHDLRHTSASLAIEAGANVKDVQNLLGHKDPQTTLKFYASVTEKSAQRTVNEIEGLLRPQEKQKKPDEKQA